MEAEDRHALLPGGLVGTLILDTKLIHGRINAVVSPFTDLGNGLL